MTEETQKTKWCWQEEFKHCIDDCGAMYCELTGATWNEWNNEDNCANCPYVIWDAQEWHITMEDEKEYEKPTPSPLPDLECCYWKSGDYCLKLKERVGYQDCSKGCEFWRKR